MVFGDACLGGGARLDGWMPGRRFFGCFAAALFVFFVAVNVSRAADAGAGKVNGDVVARYEQILSNDPETGPPFDKLLALYEDADGLQALDDRWAPLAAEPGAKGAAFTLLRGLLADRRGKVTDARALLQKAAAAQPNDFHGWLALGDFEERQGKLADAVVALQKGLATPAAGNDRLTLYRKLGNAQQRNLDMAGALATWQKMVDEFPKDRYALEEAGGAQLDAEQFDAARKTFQRLVDSTDANSMARVQALIRLAEVDDRQGKTEEAVHGYEAILPQTAEDSWLNHEIRSQIEQVYRREDDLAGLAAYYKKWIAANPSDVEALLRLSGTLNELGKNTEAVDALRKAATLDPDRHEVRETLAQRLVDAKQYDEAIAVETALTADDPTEPRYWETLGEALWFKTQPATPASTKAVLDAWHKIAPDGSKDVAAILEVGDLCREHGLNDEALAQYQRALAVSPDAVDIRERTVALLVQLKRQPEAWTLLDGMVAGAQATAGNYLKLANDDAKYDRADAAAAAIQKGLALDPKNFDLLETEWSRLSQLQKWPDAIALYDRLLAAAPNPYFADEVEARQVQALTAAGQLDATTKALRARLGGSPQLTEDELQLLARILTQESDPDTERLFAEAHQRFPRSVPLARLEIDYERKVQNFDAAVAGLERLIASAPEQKADWKTRIVEIRRDQGRMDEALKVAASMIDDSPATAPPYLLYADVALAANQPDDAVAKLQTAIRLSDNPNSVRQRLARYYIDTGDTAKARSIYDDAFAAAATPEDKLALIKPMAEAYFQDGQIDDLIARFRQQQAAEEGGWHYGQYLAEIYTQMDDFGSARRELAKSLAVRPQDTGLLHALVALAEKENDPTETLHYRQMLADVDPSTSNEIALANEFATQNKQAEAWQVLQRNLGAVSKDPLAWKDVLDNLTDPAYQAKVRALLENSIREQGDPFEGNLALAQFQMQQSDLDGAKQTLNRILDLPLPPPPPPPATPAGSGPAVSSFMGAFQTAIAQRAQQSYVYQEEAEQLLAPAARRSQMRQMVQMQLRMNGVSASSTPQTIRDRALVYLSYIAVQQQQGQAFLTDLKTRLDAAHASMEERMVDYSLVQAQGAILDTMEEQAKTGTPNADLDAYCATVCLQYQMEGVDPATAKRADALADMFTTRVAKADPRFRQQILLMQIAREERATSPDAVAKRATLLADYIKGVDTTNPEELMAAVEVSAMGGDWAHVQEFTQKLLASNRATWPTSMPSWYLPLLVVQNSGGGPLPKLAGPVFAQLLQLSYPDQKPPLALGSSTQGQSYGMQESFPPSNRYISAMQVNMMQQAFARVKAANLLPDIYTALDQQIASYSDWHKIYPIQWKIYFQWWDGQRDAATASVRQLVAQDAGDEFKVLLESMLVQQQKYAEAIPVIESISARYGPVHVQAQKDLLHAARMANDSATALKAAQRLLALRLPQEEKMQLIEDLRAVGLNDKADELAQQKTTSTSPMALMQASQQAMMELEGSSGSQDPDRLAAVAKQVLAGDPLTLTANSYDSYVRREALRKLTELGLLDEYIAGLEKQLAAAPDSVRLNWLVAEAYGAAPDIYEDNCALRPVPHWLKLQRTGNQFEAFRSLDGTNWTSWGAETLALPPNLYVGLFVTDSNGAPARITFDHVALTGKLTADTPPALAPPPAPGTGVSVVTSSVQVAPGVVVTNRRTALGLTSVPPTPPSKLPPPWSESRAQAERAGGRTEAKPDGSLVLTAGTVRSIRVADDGAARYLVYQKLEGDGSIVARVNDLSGEPQNTKAGLTMSERIPPGSRGIHLALQRESGVVRATRDPAWKDVTAKDDFKLPLWLKLIRTGDEFTALYSDDGKTWTQLFTRHQRLADTLDVGVRASNGNDADDATDITSAKFSYSLPQVTGAPGPQDPKPAPANAGVTGVPAPWRYADLGGFKSPGKVAWTDAGLEMESPWNGEGSAHPTGGFLYRPIKGDGEITVEIKDMKDSEHAKAVVFFMESPDLGASLAEFGYYMDGRFNFQVHAPAQNRSLELYQKVAQLDPKNGQALQMVAASLTAQKKYGAAADFYLGLMKTDMASLLQNSSSMLEAFRLSHRVPELVNAVTNWTPPPLNPMNGGMDSFFGLEQLAQQLGEDSENQAQAEPLYRKALAMDTYQDKMDAYSGYVALLIKENKRDEAARQLEAAFLPPAPAAPAQPILGMTRFIQRGWMQSFGFSGNGEIYSNGLNLLKQAADLRLLADLAGKLKAKAAATPASSVAMNADDDRLGVILVEVMLHDPAYRADLEKIIAGGNLVNDENGLTLIAQELVHWPAEEPEAVKLLRQLSSGAGTNNTFMNTFMATCINRIMLQLGQQAGDHKLIQEALRDEMASMAQVRAQNPNYSQLEETEGLVRPMLCEGMVKEASDLVAQLSSDQQVRNGGTNGTDRYQVLQDEVAFAQGKDVGMVLPVYGLRPGGKKGSAREEFFWQLQPGRANEAPNGRNYNSIVGWDDGRPSRPTTFALEVDAGPDVNHLTKIASMPNVASGGAMPIHVPAGARMVRAAIAKLPAGGAGASPGKVVPVPGQIILLGSGANVLPNPTFATGKDAAGHDTIPNWTGLSPSGLFRQKGGPLPASGSVAFDFRAEAVSDKIAIPPDTDILNTGWWRGTGMEMSYRFFDAAGKQLGENGTDNIRRDEVWSWNTDVAVAPGSSLNGRRMPANAAFFQVVCRMQNGSASEAGWAIHFVPHTPAAVPAGKADAGDGPPAQRHAATAL